MSDRRPTSTGCAARWLLLISTVFGLAVMHTLGHAGMQMDTYPRHALPVPAAVASGAMDMTAMTAPTAAPCSGCPDGHAMSGWDVCLAVLSGLAALVLLAIMGVSAARRSPAYPGGPARAPVILRAPPQGGGLTLASTAVLRI